MNDFEQGLANIMGSFMEVNLDCVEKQNQEIEQLKQENKQLKQDYELYKDNHIYKNYEVERKDNTIEQLKEVIEEVREYIKGFDIERLHEVCEHNLAEVLEYLLQILDKVKENK